MYKKTIRQKWIKGCKPGMIKDIFENPLDYV